jgi:hypothetical protein
VHHHLLLKLRAERLQEEEYLAKRQHFNISNDAVHSSPRVSGHSVVNNLTERN